MHTRKSKKSQIQPPKGDEEKKNFKNQKNQKKTCLMKEVNITRKSYK
jgi:hypothetical protein